MGNATLDSEVESRVQLKIAQTICNSVGTPFCRPEGFLPLDKLQASPGYIRSGRDSPEERHFHRLSPPAYGEGSNSDPESVSQGNPFGHQVCSKIQEVSKQVFIQILQIATGQFLILVDFHSAPGRTAQVTNLASPQDNPCSLQQPIRKSQNPYSLPPGHNSVRFI